MARPSSASNASRLATSTTLIADAAICRVNSLPIPDEAPVTSAHGPNCPLSRAVFIVLFLSVDCTCCSIVWSHGVPIQSFRRFTSITTKSGYTCSRVVPLVKQCVEGVDHQRFVFLFFRLTHNNFLIL